MKSVFFCAFLALAKYSFAVNVCDQEIPTDSELIVSCVGDKMLKYPNYDDMQTYYTCSGGGQPLLQRCPQNQYFCYYRQNCGSCSNFLPPPDCEFFSKKTNSRCSSNAATTTTTKSPKTTKIPVPTASTTTKAPATTRGPPSTKTPATTKTPSIPTPPTQGPPSSGIPTPPMVVTPVPGVPTPPNEVPTPPSIPGTPPMLTTIQSI